MLGKPKYNFNDKVKFSLKYKGEEYTLIGTIDIIDKFGTFEDDSDVSYDIMVNDGDMPITYPCLFKHIREDRTGLVETEASA